ncbi:hypothetical protein C0431_01620 [bacterium]|nr:hypothetical protein [bacterium]
MPPPNPPLPPPKPPLPPPNPPPLLPPKPPPPPPNPPPPPPKAGTELLSGSEPKVAWSSKMSRIICGSFKRMIGGKNSAA